jgi:hypothetical protein
VELQLAPVFAFQKIPGASGSSRYLCAGNFFDVTPYEGRYDAQPVAFFSCQNGNRITAIPQANLSALKGQFRDLKWLNTVRHGPVLVAAPNNEKLLFLKQ